MQVPENYYQFIIDHAPYIYVTPPDTPDPQWGRAAFAAAFAIDFLTEAYTKPQFENRTTEIHNKITNLANWILTQQCTDTDELAYGGFKSNENSTYYYAIDACLFELDSGKEVNAELYPTLNFYVRRDNSFNGNLNVILYDTASKMATQMVTIGASEWFRKELGVGAKNTDYWQVQSGFDWTHVTAVRFDCWFTGSGTGSFWVDGLNFGGRRYSSVQEDAASQNAYGLRELVEVDEELYSDNECALRAKALLAYLKDPAEYLTIRSTVIDYGNTPLLPGDKIHVTLPNENVDADFRILSVEYHVDAKTQTLEITMELGRETPLLADYLFALRSKTDHLSRYKIARLI
ncbi:MAG: hypothetical protein QXN36_00265 [Candidatus Bathyarchaeia archaeon]